MKVGLFVVPMKERLKMQQSKVDNISQCFDERRQPQMFRHKFPDKHMKYYWYFSVVAWVRKLTSQDCRFRSLLTTKRSYWR